MLSFSKIHPRQDIKLTLFFHKKQFHLTKSFKMPLVVPGITPQGGDKSKTEEWTNKLVGKKLGEGSSDATVRHPSGSSTKCPGKNTNVYGSRRLREQSCRRKLVSSSPVKW
jgi:hypothetical protein